MRTGLQPGTSITLFYDGTQHEFRIEKIIGEGASCIAYEATLTSGSNASLRYRIKECYPHNASISRHGTELVWHNEAERSQAFSKMKLSHTLLLDLRNDEQLGDSIVVSHLCNGNGTLYLVMQLNHATTYEHFSETSIHNVLDTARVLASHIEHIHCKGYLHLDIKPSNFLVKHDPSTVIWLFDVDSFTSIADIHSGTVTTYPYSNGYAAPEQVCGKNKKLSPATDIYAIGATLFVKIMGRPVCNEDMGLFADWDFEGPLFEDVNPKVKRILRGIFRKTLAASPTRRYQSISALLLDIQEALSVAIEGRPYLQSSFHSNTIHFIGREQELNYIHSAFTSNKHTVFLHGEGGIGKSSTAIAYAEKYKDKYDTIIFMRYRDSLEQLLDEIYICNFDAANEPGIKSRVLRQLLDRHVLLIIDNFDVDIDSDKYLSDFLSLSADLLFTSRTDFSAAYDDSITQIEIERLDACSIIELFANSSHMTYEHVAESMAFARLCKQVQYNTYLIDLLGRQCFVSGLSIDELWARVKHGITQMATIEKIWTNKDGRPVKRNLSDALRALFRIADLSEPHQEALRDLYMLRFLEVDRHAYLVHTFAKTTDVINELAERGWVQKHSNTYSLHPLVEELVRHDLQPDTSNCSVFYFIRHRIDEFIDSLTFDEAVTEFEHEYTCRFLCSFFIYSDLENPEIRKLALSWLHESMLSEEPYLPSPTHTEFAKFYNILLDLIKNNKLPQEEVILIRSVHLATWMAEYNIIHPLSEQDYAQNRASSCENAYSALLACLYNTPLQLVNQTVRDLLHFINNGCSFLLPGYIVHELYRVAPEPFNEYDSIRRNYNLPLTDEEILQQREWDEQSSNTLNKTPDNESEIHIQKYMADFRTAKSKITVLQNIISDDTLSIYEQIKGVDECIDEHFTTIRRAYMNGDHSISSWKEITSLLAFQEKLLDSSDVSNLESDEIRGYVFYSHENVVNQLLTYAVLEDLPNFECFAEELCQIVKTYSTQLLESSKVSLSELVDLTSYYNLSIHHAIKEFLLLKRASYSIPILLQFVEGWYTYAQSLSSRTVYNERGFVSSINLLLQSLEAAKSEQNIPAKYQLPYDELIQKYSNLLADITDTTFKIKSPDENT